jgi:hypothetical protein
MKKQFAIIGSIVLICTIIISGCSEQKKPVISSFEAFPNEVTAGESSQLRWNVTDASSVTIDNGIGRVARSGNQTITPMETTTYILTAQSSSTTVTASVQIVVIEEGGKPNITMAQVDFYIVITDTNNTRINQSRVFVIAINKRSGENQTSTLEPTITEGDGNLKILGAGDAITFQNLDDFEVGEVWDILVFYKGDIIGQCIFTKTKEPYDIPIVRMLQSGSSVTIVGIINGPLQQNLCTLRAVNTTSGAIQTSEIGATLIDGDNNPTVLGIGDQITFQNIIKFRKGDQWTIQLEYGGEIIGQCTYTKQSTIIVTPP